MAASQTTSSIPQGFSVYQPMLGAPLQFFPALGTKELDDLLDTYVPGQASLKEKRASVSVDFLDYAQRTGQPFKFYAVPGLTAAVAESPASGSPLQASVSSSSANVSPVTSNWDWSSVSGPLSSQSTQRRSSGKGSSATSSRRHAPADFSSLPGMKILTREGLDVTNSASRGSKTKEQRDHAHLMRIIKACDDCRKKKIRCDPSHRKRSSSSSQAQSQPASKPRKKAKTLPKRTPSAAPPPTVIDDMIPNPQTPVFDLDTPIDLPELDSFAYTTSVHEPWEDFIHYPPAGADPDYDFFLDPQGYLLPQQQQKSWSSSSSVSPHLSSTSDSQLVSQGYSSISSSDSPNLADYTIPRDPSLSNSPEAPNLEGYVMPPDLSMPKSPEMPGGGHDQLFQTMWQSTIYESDKVAQDGDVNEPIGWSTSSEGSGLGRSGLFQPVWKSASGSPQGAESSIVSQPISAWDSPESSGVNLQQSSQPLWQSSVYDSPKTEQGGVSQAISSSSPSETGVDGQRLFRPRWESDSGPRLSEFVPPSTAVASSAPLSPSRSVMSPGGEASASASVMPWIGIQISQDDEASQLIAEVTGIKVRDRVAVNGAEVPGSNSGIEERAQEALASTDHATRSVADSRTEEPLVGTDCLGASVPLSNGSSTLTGTDCLVQPRPQSTSPALAEEQVAVAQGLPHSLPQPSSPVLAEEPLAGTDCVGQLQQLQMRSAPSLVAVLGVFMYVALKVLLGQKQKEENVDPCMVGLFILIPLAASAASSFSLYC